MTSSIATISVSATFLAIVASTARSTSASVLSLPGLLRIAWTSELKAGLAVLVLLTIVLAPPWIVPLRVAVAGRAGATLELAATLFAASAALAYVGAGGGGALVLLLL